MPGRSAGWAIGLFGCAGLDPVDDGFDLGWGEGFLAFGGHGFVVVAGQEDGADDFGSAGITGGEGGAGAVAGGEGGGPGVESESALLFFGAVTGNAFLVEDGPDRGQGGIVARSGRGFLWVVGPGTEEVRSVLGEESGAVGEGSAVMTGDGKAEETGEEDQAESDKAAGCGVFEEECMEGAGNRDQGAAGDAPAAVALKGEFVIAAVAGPEITEDHGEAGGDDPKDQAELDHLASFGRGLAPGPEFEQGDQGQESDGQVQQHHVERAEELLPREGGGNGCSRIRRGPCRAAKARQQEQAP